MNIVQLKTSCQIYAYLKYPKTQFIECVRKSLDVHNNVTFDLAELPRIAHISSLDTQLSAVEFYCSTQKKLNSGKLWVWDKFEKSAIYGEFKDMQASSDKLLIFTYAHDSEIFAVSESSGYTGLGGIFVRPHSSSCGIVIEPFKHCLAEHLPLPVEL